MFDAARNAVVLASFAGALAGPGHAQRPPPYGPRIDGPQDGAPTPYDRDALTPSKAAVARSGGLTPDHRGDDYPTRIWIYGLVSAGIRKKDQVPAFFNGDPCGPREPQTDEWSIDSVERSRIGARGDETLSRGWVAHLELEQSFDASTGLHFSRCGQHPDARATVGLSERRFGRFDLGRIDQAAWSLVLRADPWGGSGSASPDWRLYVPPEGRAQRWRTAATYASPAEHRLRLTLQYGEPLAQDGAGQRGGMSVAWDTPEWLIGAGWQSWPGDSQAMPIVVAHDTGSVRLSGALTIGRVAGVDYRNFFLGLTNPVMAKGDPRRIEWRIGANRHVVGKETGDWQSDTKISLGWRWRWTPQAWFAIGGALVRPRNAEARGVLDVSVGYSFERDLRRPQWP